MRRTDDQRLPKISTRSMPMSATPCPLYSLAVATRGLGKLLQEVAGVNLRSESFQVRTIDVLRTLLRLLIDRNGRREVKRGACMCRF